MTSFRVLFCFALAVSACASSREAIRARSPIAELNTHDLVAVKGYDPVAYFTEAKPIRGNPQISCSWKGAKWYFSSNQNRAAFGHDPEKYAPQFGGYCAFAMSKGNIADIRPNQWNVVDAKLYLNNNAFARALWNSNRAAKIKSGNANWKIMPRKPLPSAIKEGGSSCSQYALSH